LHQVNHEDGDTWKIWEQPLSGREWQEASYAMALRTFWAAEAARRQGKEAFRRYHLALLRERHQRGQKLGEPETLRAVAARTGLDLEVFARDLNDPGCLQRLAEDYTRAEGLDVFGAPTFVFPGADPAYLKLTRLLAPEEALGFWDEFYSVVAQRPYVLEIKRPH
jgi:predicted DsbA family dithiol-disulfide isomerase